MNKSIVIAVDAMGGDNSPKKVIAGISEYLKKIIMFFLEYLEKNYLKLY